MTSSSSGGGGGGRQQQLLLLHLAILQDLPQHPQFKVGVGLKSATGRELFRLSAIFTFSEESLFGLAARAAHAGDSSPSGLRPLASCILRGPLAVQPTHTD